jgi:chloride channel protein, CIC family
MAGEIEPANDLVLPVKFLGGLLSLGSGMALGREGPTVQMGASIGHIVAPWFVTDRDDERVVLAAGAEAGLAVAFNAPIGGSDDRRQSPGYRDHSLRRAFASAV